MKAGYKKTHIGIIPDDWQAVALGEIKTLMTNGFVGIATRHYTRNDTGVLYIHGYNIEENSFNLHGVKFVSDSFHRQHLKSCLRAGDLLTVQTGDVGLTAVVPEWMEGANCHALIITRLTRKNVYPTFVSYYLNSDPGRARLRLIETGTTMKHLNVGDMLHFEVPLPILKEEQQTIASALGDADALIASLDALIAKKRDLKQAAMQQLLTGKTRLPGFKGEWQDKKVNEFGQIVRGRTPKTTDKNYWSGDIPWITPTDITDRRDILTSERLISEEGLDQLRPLPENSLLVTCVASIGKNSILKVRGACNQQINAVILNSKYNSEFLYYLMEFKKDYLLVKAGVTATSIISKRDFSEITFSVPDHDEQIAIAKILSDMDADLIALGERRAKARAIKQGMMQELLSGRIRLV